MIGAQSMAVMVLPSLGVVVDNAMFPKDAVLRHRNLCLVRNGPSLRLAPTPHYSRAFSVLQAPPTDGVRKAGPLGILL